MDFKALCLALVSTAGLTLTAGCSALKPAEPIGADEQYVCQVGSGLKYRKPRSQSWPEFLVPRAPAGSCMHR